MVRQLLGSCTEQVHSSRVAAVVRVVEAMTVAAQLTVTAVGRARRGSQQARHGIKAVDRLLSNSKLQRERLTWWSALVRKLVRAERRILVLLDWTQLHGDRWALVAAVPFRGRSLPILAEAHNKSQVGSRTAHVDFLRKLRRILPERCTPVIVADGGFRSPFFVACEALRLKYVVRLRNERSVLVGAADGKRSFGDAFDRASSVSQCLGESAPYATSRDSVCMRIVLGPRPNPKRHRRSAKDYERKRALEPWLLGTNLENDAAAQIVLIYAQRMQIEEYFRDAKCPRFGWALRFSLTKSLARLNTLLLLTALAFACVVLIGAAAVDAGLERTLRASSTRKRVLSFFSVGRLIIKDRALARIRLHSALKHLKALRTVSRSLFPKIAPPRSENRNVSLPRPHDLFCVDCGWRGAEWGWPP
jgi:hypothetical protein